jgi:hypothetical protein
MKLLWRYVLVVAALRAGSLLLISCGEEREEEGAAPAAATEAAAPMEARTEEVAANLRGRALPRSSSPRALPWAATILNRPHPPLAHHCVIHIP